MPHVLGDLAAILSLRSIKQDQEDGESKQVFGGLLDHAALVRQASTVYKSLSECDQTYRITEGKRMLFSTLAATFRIR